MEGASSPEKQAPSLIDYLHLLWGKKLTVALFLVAGLLFNGVRTLRMTPRYQARTTMEVITANNGESLVGLQDAESGGGYATYFQTQVQVLHSQALHRRVVNKLKERNGVSTFVPTDSLSVWRSKLHLGAPKATPKGYEPPVDITINVLDASRVIEIVCQSPDPEYAAAFANALAGEYIDFSLEASWESGQKTVNYLTRQLKDLGSKMEESERELQSYSAEVGLNIDPAPGNVEELKLKQLQVALSDAQADRMAKQAALTIATASSPEAVPQIVDNERLSAYQSKLAELRRELAELSIVYTPEYSGVRRVRAQITELETTLQREGNSILARIQNDYKSALGREDLLGAAYEKQSLVVSDVARKSIRYGLLKREVETSRQLYQELLQKVKQIGISTGLPSANVQLLDAAERPNAPFEPNLLSNLAVGMAGGMLLGIGVVIAAEFANRSLRSPGESAFSLAGA